MYLHVSAANKTCMYLDTGMFYLVCFCLYLKSDTDKIKQYVSVSIDLQIQADINIQVY